VARRVTPVSVPLVSVTGQCQWSVSVEGPKGPERTERTGRGRWEERFETEARRRLSLGAPASDLLGATKFPRLDLRLTLITDTDTGVTRRATPDSSPPLRLRLLTQTQSNSDDSLISSVNRDLCAGRS
jgi:hypothetical protein